MTFFTCRIINKFCSSEYLGQSTTVCVKGSDGPSHLVTLCRENWMRCFVMSLGSFKCGPVHICLHTMKRMWSQLSQPTPERRFCDQKSNGIEDY